MLQEKLRHAAIPQELVFGWPRTVLLGDEKLIVEQHQGIYTCTEQEIILKTLCGLLVITGEKLSLTRYDRDGLVERIRQRERLRFGERVLEGGDLYASQQRFRAFAAGRSEEPILAALQTLSCPVLKLDATLPPEVLADEILRVFHNL